MSWLMQFNRVLLTFNDKNISHITVHVVRTVTLQTMKGRKFSSLIQLKNTKRTLRFTESCSGYDFHIVAECHVCFMCPKGYTCGSSVIAAPQSLLRIELGLRHTSRCAEIDFWVTGRRMEETRRHITKKLCFTSFRQNATLFDRPFSELHCVSNLSTRTDFTSQISKHFSINHGENNQTMDSVPVSAFIFHPIGAYVYDWFTILNHSKKL